MKKLPLDSTDHGLIKAAHRAFEESTRHDRHGVSAAIRLKSGSIVTGLVQEAEVPALTMCAEPITIGRALAEIATDPDVCVVATREREEVTIGSFRRAGGAGSSLPTTVWRPRSSCSMRPTLAFTRSRRVTCCP